ncbi:4-alpha-glucanotransferase [Histidinibacterium lentulum]|uniref:4-alpha-glucanotransferase n=1 Tax=Histidinibacterium lentulum TaxID=2480588 RepID=A0A3N2R8X2_9RHOB|nr:4-alpha-glucanotransferase [Histidinibacterium lentulum]ROU03914.1 4-alpha-glucanotransferase [Histidinibacterium lentulum]
MSALERLMERIGIEPGFEDALGASRPTDPDVARSLARELGFPAADEREARRTLARLDAEAAQRPLPPVIVTTCPGGRLDLPADGARRGRTWTLLDGETEVTRRTAPDGESVALDVPEALGRYRLRLDMEGRDPAETVLMVAPDACWTPPALAEDGKIWGVSVQLYLLRSARNWGIGDFTDLARFVEIAADWGADMIGLNPLNAGFLDDPDHASPYSPASRLFLNVLYIDVGAVPRFGTDPAVRAQVEDPEFRRRLEACRAADLVDYSGVAALKVPVLEALHRAFRDGASAREQEDFAAFRRERGQALERFCRFSALRAHFAAQTPARADWRTWPAPFRDCRSDEIARFAADHAGRIEFHAWMQWIAEGQLARAAAETERRGMAVGLYRDLAVGADAAGAESWSNPEAVLSGLQIGAPPDMLNPAGQNWVLPPFDPNALRQEAHASYADLVRANMRHAGGLRIDHVMALQHLYLIPEGHPPTKGAYVTYPMEELLAVLALESHERPCLIVGEDLGTVPEGFRERMAEARVLSYRIAMFERDEKGAFVPPGDYPRAALAMLGSHDLATLRGWWESRDIDLKARHGLYASKDEEGRQRAQREEEHAAFVAALEDAGLLDAGEILPSEPFGPRIAAAAHGFLGLARSGLAVAQLEDLLDQAEQVNLPGTVEAHPNWRLRYRLPLESLAEDAGALARIEALKAARAGAAEATRDSPDPA